MHLESSSTTLPLTQFRQYLLGEAGLKPSTADQYRKLVGHILRAIGYDPRGVSALDQTPLRDGTALRRYFERGLTGYSLWLYDLAWGHFWDFAASRGALLPRVTHDLFHPLPPEQPSPEVQAVALSVATRLAHAPVGYSVPDEIAECDGTDLAGFWWDNEHDDSSFYVRLDVFFQLLALRVYDDDAEAARILAKHPLRLGGHIKLAHPGSVSPAVRQGGYAVLVHPVRWPPYSTWHLERCVRLHRPTLPPGSGLWQDGW